jgi:hypothetical protein
MATGAAWLKGKNHLVRKRKTDLTLTGLLMEGLGNASDKNGLRIGLWFWLFRD